VQKGEKGESPKRPKEAFEEKNKENCGEKKIREKKKKKGGKGNVIPKIGAQGGGKKTEKRVIPIKTRSEKTKCRPTKSGISGQNPPVGGKGKKKKKQKGKSETPGGVLFLKA